MSERTKRVFIGMASGLATGLPMEFLRGGGYLTGASMLVRAIFACAIAVFFYFALNTGARLLKKGGGEQAQG